MTSQAAGSQWLRNPYSSFAKPRNHHLTQHTPRSVPRQATTDLTTGSVSDNSAEPPFKRQKLDGTSHVHRVDSESSRRNFAAGSSEEKTLVECSAKDSTLQLSGSASEYDQVEFHTRRGPILPLRPWGEARRHRVSVEASGKVRVKEAVQIRSYVAEPPPSAPRYQEDGRLDIVATNS